MGSSSASGRGISRVPDRKPLVCEVSSVEAGQSRDVGPNAKAFRGRFGRSDSRFETGFAIMGRGIVEVCFSVFLRVFRRNKCVKTLCFECKIECVLSVF